MGLGLVFGTNFCGMSVGWGNYWVSNGQPSSFVWMMGICVERLIEICFPGQSFGPLVGWRPDARRAAMFLATIEEQSGDPLFRE